VTTNGQMERLIRAAQNRVAENAEAASDRDVLLACFGWIDSKLERRHRPPWPSLAICGAVAGAAVAAFGRVLGWY